MNPVKKIPKRLKEFEFRFYLCGRGDVWGKRPIETAWNKSTNYHFFDEKLLTHTGNYGVVTGFGGLIVLDFDCGKFYNSIKGKLKPTFTVRSASRQLPHLYYLLKGDMIAKTSVRDSVTQETLMDLQAQGVGVVAPYSVVGERYYTIERDVPIMEITLEELKSVFKFETKKYVESSIDFGKFPEAVASTHKYLCTLGLKLSYTKKYKCPFHTMGGTGNLAVMPNGWIYCFHEQKTWKSPMNFIAEYCSHTEDEDLWVRMAEFHSEVNNGNY